MKFDIILQNNTSRAFHLIEGLENTSYTDLYLRFTEVEFTGPDGEYTYAVLRNDREDVTYAFKTPILDSIVQTEEGDIVLRDLSPITGLLRVGTVADEKVYYDEPISFPYDGGGSEPEPEPVIEFVDYIHSSVMGNEAGQFLYTDIYPTIHMKGRIKGQMKDYHTNNVLVGHSGVSDATDWRLFFLELPIVPDRDWYFDIGVWRVEGVLGQIRANDDIDIEWGVIPTENDRGYRYLKNQFRTVQSSNLFLDEPYQLPIQIEMGVIWFSELQLWDEDTLIFDGKAARQDGVLGVYDRVNHKFYTNPELNLVAETNEDDNNEILYYE